MKICNLGQSLSYILRHPFNEGRKLRALWIWFRWQILSRVRNGKHVHQFVNDTKLYVQQGQTGVTGNIYCGLHEWNDMAFVLHFLRPGDLFVDVGANVGSYTILASGAVKAETIAVEPIYSTYRSLLDNIALNSLDHLVKPLNIGLAASSGSLNFTNNLDTVNHVVRDPGENSILVNVDTLDHICSITPDLIKIDVEGYEYEVLSGAQRILSDNELLAVIVEWNLNTKKTKNIAELMLSNGFIPMSYEPKRRELRQVEIDALEGNILFIKDYNLVKSRISSSVAFQVQGRLI